METYRNLNKSTRILLAIVTLSMMLAAVGVVGSLIQFREINKVIHSCMNATMIILISFYAVFGYKKPHGNLLRITFFLFGVMLIAQKMLPSPASRSDAMKYLTDGAAFLSALLISYISGRLNRFDKNKILIIVVGALLLTSRLTVVLTMNSLNVFRLISQLSPLICWTALSLAYTARYEEHKAAGLEDKAAA